MTQFSLLSPLRKDAESETSGTPILLKYRSSKWLILSTVSIAVFTDVFLYGVIVPVIPFALTNKAGVPPDQVQYYVSVLLAVYGAALLGASPICGYFADRSSSRRLPLMLGLLALAGSTVMLTVGNSVGILIAGRVLQGISAAVVWVVGLALLVDTVGKDRVGQAMGYVGMSMSLAMISGPLLGGVVFAKGGYYAVFAMAFGLIVFDIGLRAIMIEKKVAAKWSVTKSRSSNYDSREECPSPAAAEQYYHTEDERQTGTQQAIDDSCVRAVSTLNQHTQPADTSASSRAERLTQRLPAAITLLASRRLLASLWGSLVLATLVSSFDSVLPLFVSDAFFWNSTGAGLIFLPVIVPTFFGPLIGFLSDRYGPRWLATSGFLAACPFFICLRFITHNSLQQKVLLCALLALIGTSMTLVYSPLLAEITYVVEAKERRKPGLFGTSGAYAQAYGLFNCAFAGGCLVGPIWAGLVKEKAGWGTMAWSLGLFSAVTALPTCVWTGGLITRAERVKEEQEKSAEDV